MQVTAFLQLDAMAAARADSDAALETLREDAAKQDAAAAAERSAVRLPELLQLTLVLSAVHRLSRTPMCTAWPSPANTVSLVGRISLNVTATIVLVAAMHTSLALVPS